MEYVNTEMKMQEVIQVAKDLGLPFKIGTKKQDLVDQVNKRIEVVNMDEQEFEESGQERNFEDHPMEAEEPSAEGQEQEQEQEQKHNSKREQTEQYVQALLDDHYVQEMINKQDTKAARIRALLRYGIERKYVARVLDIKYQMVYQVQQRMLANDEKERIQDQARKYKDIIKQMEHESAMEEYGEEIVAEVNKLVEEE